MRQKQDRESLIPIYVNRINELLDTGVFRNNELNTFGHSVLIEILINLLDLLLYCKDNGNRICFTDDVIPGKDIEDVTDLIKVCRDALCHTFSGIRNLSPGHVMLWYVNYPIALGTMGNPEGFVAQLENTYSDDLCLFVGKYRLYLHRHIIRAFREVEQFTRQNSLP